MRLRVLPAAFAVALAWSAAAHAAGPAVPADSTGAFRQDVAWSPDGRSLAWSEHPVQDPFRPGDWAVWIARRNGSQRRRLVANAEWVSFSPDGSRLAYSAERDGNWDIWTVRADGTDVRRLTLEPGRDRQPAWSPTGDSIAFVSDREGYAQLWLVAASGGTARRITHDSLVVDNPQWSPDGRELVFHAAAGQNIDRVHVVSLEQGAAWTASPEGAHDIYPAFLEDGRIVFSAVDASGIQRPMTMLPDGSGRETHPGGPAFFVRGSRDGRWLARISGAFPRSRIVVSRADGSDPREFADGQAP